MEKLNQVRKVVVYFCLALLIFSAGIYFGGKAQFKKNQFIPLTNLDEIIYEVTIIGPTIKKLLKSNNNTTDNNLNIKKKDKRKPIGEFKISLDKNFLYSYYEEETEKFTINLLDLNTNKVLSRWAIPYERVNASYLEWVKTQRKNYPHSELNRVANRNHKKVGLKAPILTKDSLMVTKLGTFYLNGPILAFDKKGVLKWQSEEIAHHTMQLDDQGRIWTCSFLKGPQLIQNARCYSGNRCANG